MAHALLLACDFFVVMTASFRTLYVFVIMQLGTRRILHHNVTDHPTAEWTLQQFREALPDDHPYRFVIHDRDSIFSQELDKGVTAMGMRVVRTPVRAPQANSICERFGGPYAANARRTPLQTRLKAARGPLACQPSRDNAHRGISLIWPWIMRGTRSFRLRIEPWTFHANRTSGRLAAL
jgi:hypothetical protein